MCSFRGGVLSFRCWALRRDFSLGEIVAVGFAYLCVNLGWVSCLFALRCCFMKGKGPFLIISGGGGARDSFVGHSIDFGIPFRSIFTYVVVMDSVVTSVFSCVELSWFS